MAAKLDYCRGFLDALALLNSEASDLAASYELHALPAAPDLAGALGLRVEDYAKNVIAPARDLPAPMWQIASRKLDAGQFDTVLQRWFFSSEHMQAAQGGAFRRNLQQAFAGALLAALDGYAACKVSMQPPMWYAIDWDEIAFERGHGMAAERYLLHFSHSD